MSDQKQRKKKKDDPYKYFRDKQKKEQGLSVSDPEDYMSEEESSSDDQEIIIEDSKQKQNDSDVSSFKDSSSQGSNENSDAGDYSDPDYELSVSKKKDSPVMAQKKKQELQSKGTRKHDFVKTHDIDSGSASNYSQDQEEEDNFSIHLEQSGIKKPQAQNGDYANKGSRDQSDSESESSEKYTNHSQSKNDDQDDEESFSVNEVTSKNSTKKKNKRPVVPKNDIDSDDDIDEDSVHESSGSEQIDSSQNMMSTSVKKSGEHLTFSAHSVGNQNEVTAQAKTKTNAMSLVGDTMVNKASVVHKPKIVDDTQVDDFNENDVKEDQDLQKKSVEQMINEIPSRFPQQNQASNFRVNTTKSNKTSNVNPNKDLTGIISPNKKQQSQAKSNAILNKRPTSAIKPRNTSNSRPSNTQNNSATRLKPQNKQLNTMTDNQPGAKKPRPPTANINRTAKATPANVPKPQPPKLTKEEDQLKAKAKFEKIQDQKALKDQKLEQRIAKNLVKKKIIGKDQFDYKQANKDLSRFKLDHADAKDWFNDSVSEDEIQAQAKQQRQPAASKDYGRSLKKVLPGKKPPNISQGAGQAKEEAKKPPQAKQKSVQQLKNKQLVANKDIEDVQQQDDEIEEDGGLFDEEKAESGDQALAPQDKSQKEEDDNDLFKEEQAESGDQALFQASNKNSMSGSGSQISQKSISASNKDSINRKSQSSVASQVQKKKPVLKDPKPKKHGWGWNGLASMTESQKAKDAELKKEKEREAQEKFKQIKAEQRAKGDDPNVLAAILNNQKKEKEFKDKDKQDNINQRVKEFKINEQKATVADGKEKMPVDAALLNDNEKLKKEISDLKKELKELYQEHKLVTENVEVGEKKSQETKTDLEKTMKEKHLILVNGKFQMHDPNAPQKKVSKHSSFNMLDIPEYDKIAEKENFMENIVKVFEENGYTAKQAYDMLDYDGDQVLTLEEIKDGLKQHDKIKLKDTEFNELLKQIDANGDGVLTEEEWVNILHPKVEAQQHFAQIMQGIQIQDPLELQVQTLNMVYEIKMMETDLKLLQKAQGSIEQVRKKKEDMKKKSQEMAQKLKESEQKAKEKKEKEAQDNAEVEENIKKRIYDKNTVHGQLMLIQEECNKNEEDHHNAIKEVLGDLNLLEVQYNDKFIYNEKLKRQLQDVTRKDDRQTFMLTQAQELEAKLDKTIEDILGRALTDNDLQMQYQIDLKMLNQLQTTNPKIKGFMRELAASNIQRIWRGGKARLFAKLLFIQQKDQKAKLTEFLKKRKAKQEFNACLLLQRQWRLFKQRKIQLEKIQEENHIRRKQVMSKYSQEELKKVQERAVNLIIKHWKVYKASNKMKMSNFARSVHQSMAMGKTLSVVEMKKLVMCQICKKVRGERQCPSCGDYIYCEEHFKIYHSKGSRRTHNYNRIKFLIGSANVPLDDTMNTASFGKDNSFVREQVSGKFNQKDSDGSDDDFGRA